MTDARDRRRPRGRPRVEPHSTVSVWVESRLHDALLARARQQEQSLSKTVRELLAGRIVQLDKSRDG